MQIYSFYICRTKFSVHFFDDFRKTFPFYLSPNKIFRPKFDIIKSYRYLCIDRHPGFKVITLTNFNTSKMSILSIFRGNKAPQYPTDTIQDKEGNKLTFTFFKHASFCITLGEHNIYIDPVSEYAEYSLLPKADIVLITHSHYDHFDRAAVDDITTRHSTIICDKTTAEAFDGEPIVMTPGTKTVVGGNITIEAVAAYNTSEGHTDFHPQAREDCGYIITLDSDTRIYIAGDTEPTPEMLALTDIDIAFLPVNQPYTMTVNQAVEAVKAIRPKIFYPYHYGEVEEKTDIERLKRELEGITDVRVFPME